MLKLKLRKIKRWLKYNPPFSLTSTGWRLFNQDFQEKAPIRYWLNHNFPSIFVYPIQGKIRKINEYFYYRVKCKNHILNTGLKPGYHEFGDKLLHVSFNMLVDFVEIEKAQLHLFTDNTKYRKSFFKRFRKFQS